MFTGLIQDVGRLQASHPKAGGATLEFRTQLSTEDWELGESVAVHGACLTVTRVQGQTFWVDCSPETLRRTVLGGLRVGAGVHLERALRLGDRLGGHLVSGHVDGVGTLRKKQAEGNALLLEFDAPGELMRYMIEKGSICINGVSLTLNAVSERDFAVAIIPHTLEKTALGELRVGQDVNLEVDMVGKYIERLVAPWSAKTSSRGGLDESFLKEHGFL